MKDARRHEWRGNLFDAVRRSVLVGAMAVSIAISAIGPVCSAASTEGATNANSVGWIKSKYGLGTDMVHVDRFPNLNEQVGASLIRNTASLDYVIRAETQTDSYGYGDAYLLNGLTDKGYWYQIGINYNAAGMDNRGPFYFPGFQVVFNVYGPDRKPIVLPSNEAGMLDFNGKINEGDRVELRLYFDDGCIVMDAHDLDTNARATIGYSAMGAEYFSGTQHTLNQNGFFTGPMLERYTAGDNMPVRLATEEFVPTKPVTSPVWLWTDLYALGDTATGVYSLATNTPVSPDRISDNNPFIYTFPQPSQNTEVEYRRDGTFIIDPENNEISGPGGI